MEPCCDDPDCEWCYGSGVYEPDEPSNLNLEQCAKELDFALKIGDMNTDRNKQLVRRLMELAVVYHVIAQTYTKEE